jgi:hypothetical protein
MACRTRFALHARVGVAYMLATHLQRSRAAW